MLYCTWRRTSFGVGESISSLNHGLWSCYGVCLVSFRVCLTDPFGGLQIIYSDVNGLPLNSECIEGAKIFKDWDGVTMDSLLLRFLWVLGLLF